MKIFNLMYRQPGKEEDKSNWTKVGVLIEKEDGKRSIKLDTVPVGSNWDGWLTVVEQKPKEDLKEEKKEEKKGEKGGKK